MNFLEQLAAEWYEYNGHFVRTNIHFGPRKLGGYVGEMDVVAYNPQNQDFIHIETSTDSDKWITREEKFKRKFLSSRKYYPEIFPNIYQLGMKFREIAIFGFNITPKQTWPWKFLGEHLNCANINTEIIHIPKFLQDIHLNLSQKDPQKDAVPESYPLLRAIQYFSFYNRNIKR